MIEYIEEAHLYLLNCVIIPSVTQILEEKVFPDKYKNVPKWILDKKAKYGSTMHSLIEDYENKKEYQIDSVYIKESFKQYLDIKKQYNLEVISQEEIVHYKEYYAGRYDMTAKINGKLCLVDIKTTAVVDKEYLSWQLSMYELAIGTKFDKLYCLWLPKGGLGKLIEIERKEKEEIEKMLGE